MWEMFSLKVPFDSLTFTSQIAAALQSNELPQFAPEWDVPPPIQDVVKECLGLEPDWRPDFDEILEELIQIAEGFPSLHPIVIKKWKQNGQSEMSDRDTAAQLLRQNLTRLEKREADIMEQIQALTVSLHQVRDQKNQITQHPGDSLHDV